MALTTTIHPTTPLLATLFKAMVPTGINFEGEPATGSHHATVINNISVGNGYTPPTGSFGGNLRVRLGFRRWNDPRLQHLQP